MRSVKEAPAGGKSQREIPAAEKLENPRGEKMEIQVFERLSPALVAEAVGATCGRPDVGTILELLGVFEAAARLARSAGLTGLAEHALVGFDAATALCVAHRRGLASRGGTT